MYCNGPGKYFSNHMKLLISSGLTTTEASVAAIYVNYSPYDTLRINTTAFSYMIKSIQYGLREAGLPVTITESINKPTDTYLTRIFGDWRAKKWGQILLYIERNKHILADKLLVSSPIITKNSIPWKII